MEKNIVSEKEAPEVTEQGQCCQKQSQEKSLPKEAMLVAGAVLLGSLIIAGAILTLAPRNAAVPAKSVAAGDTAVPAQDTAKDTTAVTSLDDDAVMGDKTKAKVAIVEFTDFECPFCKRFHTETFDALVKEYVATGKAILVTRDFPLSFHDPKATMEAATAECVRKEKGDSAYFAFGKSVYENTQANGKGLPEGKLDQLIAKVGANPKTVNACATTDAVKAEIAKDIADGGKAGVSGTPSFVVGTLGSDGTVTGELVVGAQPLPGFAAVIEKYLAK